MVTVLSLIHMGFSGKKFDEIGASDDSDMVQKR